MGGSELGPEFGGLSPGFAKLAGEGENDAAIGIGARGWRFGWTLLLGAQVLDA